MRSHRLFLTVATTAAVAATAAVITMVARGSISATFIQDGFGASLSVPCPRGPTNTPPPTLKPGQVRTPLPPDLRPASTRMAEIDEARRRGFEATSKLISSGCDPRNLPMVAATHLDGGWPQTLEQALQKADLVVTAHVSKTAFSVIEGDPIPTAESTLTIDVTLKGDAPHEITLYQGGGPVTYNGGSIEIFEGDPVLLRGDEVLLLAQRRTQAAGYWSVYPVGKYYIRDGVVHVPDGSPCNWIEGRSLDDLLQMVRASLSYATQDAAQPCDWSRF